MNTIDNIRYILPWLKANDLALLRAHIERVNDPIAAGEALLLIGFSAFESYEKDGSACLNEALPVAYIIGFMEGYRINRNLSPEQKIRLSQIREEDA